MKATLILLACAVMPLMGAVEGVVVNKSTGKPQPGVAVTMTTMGAEGMKPAGSAVSGPDGKFKIDAPAAQMHLLQAQYQGVTYSVQAPAGAGAAQLTVEVFDAKPAVAAMDYEQHMILLETDGQQLVVNETIIVNNDSQNTWYDSKAGTVRFTAPAALKGGEDLKARVLAPNSVPVERQPKSAGKGLWTMDVPVKPGQTRFDISYRLPATAPVTYEGKILHEPGPVRLVVPAGITVKGDGLNVLGTEPQTKAQVFGVKEASFRVTLEGTGSLREAAASGAGGGQAEGGGQEDSGPRITQIDPPGYARQWKLVSGLVAAALILGFWSMYLRGANASAGGRRKA